MKTFHKITAHVVVRAVAADRGQVRVQHLHGVGDVEWHIVTLGVVFVVLDWERSLLALPETDLFLSECCTNWTWHSFSAAAVLWMWFLSPGASARSDLMLFTNNKILCIIICVRILINKHLFLTIIKIN